MRPRYFVVDFETTGLDYEKDLPIEIGGLICDKNWTIIDTINLMIEWPELVENDFCHIFESWLEPHWSASSVHKISFEKYKSSAIPYDEVVDILEKKLDGSKPIIVSDCANFEWNFMSKLLSRTGRKITDMFHYCAWDTNLLLNVATDVGDPVPVHRAFQDATLLYKAIVKALAKVSEGSVE